MPTPSTSSAGVSAIRSSMLVTRALSAVTCRLGCLPVKIDKCAFPSLESFEYCAFHIIPREDAVASVAYTGPERRHYRLHRWLNSSNCPGLGVFPGRRRVQVNTHRRSEHIPGLTRGSVGGTFVGILETHLKHVGYELDMLVYAFDKLLLVEPLSLAASRRGRSMR